MPLVHTLHFKLFVFFFWLMHPWGFPGGSDGKQSADNAGLIPESGRSPGEVHGIPIQYSCLENSMDRGTWWSMVHGVAKSQTRLKQHSTEYILIPLFAQRWAQNVFPSWNPDYPPPPTPITPSSVSSGMLWTSFSWHCVYQQISTKLSNSCLKDYELLEDNSCLFIFLSLATSIMCDT